MDAQEREYRERLRILSMMAVALVILALAFLVMLLVPSAVAGGVVGDQPPASGDWVIGNDTVVTDTTVDIDGSVTINAKLTLKDSTLRLSVVDPSKEGIQVNPGGGLFANDSTIESGSGGPYLFDLLSEMDLLRVTVRDAYGGVHVNTASRVSIVEVLFERLNVSALRLEDVSNAVVNDVRIHDGSFRAWRGNSLNADDGSGTLDHREFLPGIIQVDGGHPHIDGVDISINGTFYYDVAYYQNAASGGLSLDLEWPMLDVRTESPMTVLNVTLRDSTVGPNVTVTFPQSQSDSYAHVSFGVSGVVFHNYRDATVRGFNLTNFRHHEIFINVTGQPGTTLSKQRNDWRNRAVHAYVDETFDTAGPHSFDLELVDVSSELRDRVLLHELVPGHTGAASPTFESRVRIHDVTSYRCYAPILFRVEPSFDVLKTFDLDIEVSDCTFRLVNGPCIEFEYLKGPELDGRRSIELNEMTVVDNCTFTRCRPVDAGIIRASANLNAPHTFNSTLVVSDSSFFDNAGTLLNIAGAGGARVDRLVLDGNVFRDNGCSDTDQLMVIGRQVVEITNNSLEDNVCSNGISLSHGGVYTIDRDVHIKDPCTFLVANNSFSRNWADWYDDEARAFIEVLWGGELEIARNVINGTVFRFMNLTEYPLHTRPCTLDFHHNRVEWNRNEVLYFLRTDRYHKYLEATIRDNEVWDNEGALVDYQIDYDAILNHDYDAAYRLLDNDVRGAGSTVFRNYGNITVSGNDFTECAGWVLMLENIRVSRPMLLNNSFLRCGDAIYIGAKINFPLQILLWMDHNYIDCNGTGVYAYYMEVTMYSTVVTSNATRPVVAHRSLVDAYGCDFATDGCEVVVDGYLRMWYLLDARVNWASRAGVDSGNPVVAANVTFIDQHDVESLTVYSDGEGWVERAEVLAWHIEHSTDPVVRNPYTVVVSLSSFRSQVVMNVSRDHKDAEALTLLLWDPDDPVVSLDGPEDGSVHNTLDLEVSGFATDSASGVFSLTVQVDDGEPVNITGIEEDGSYLHLLEAVPEGIHRLLVTARDAGLNVATDSITVEVDRTPPRLVVTYPSEELHTNGTEVTVRGEVEPGAELMVNLQEIAVPGANFEVTLLLNEGANYIGLSATDEAGNVASVVVWVHRDTFDPVLTLFGPQDGVAVNGSEVRVWGQAEDYDAVTISLLRRFTNIVDRPVYPEEEGMFEVWAELEEGENEIVVTAEDRAGNTVTLVRTVTLDTTPPTLEVLSPENDALLKERQVTVVFTASEDADQVYVNGKRVLGTGALETVVMLGEGENPITIVALDHLWNRFSVGLTVHVDTAPPTLELTEPNVSTVMTNDPAVVVRGRASDGDLNGITVSVEGQLATVTADGKFYHLLLLEEDGTHRVEVVARDRAGNVARTSFTVELRTVAPVLSLVFDPAGDRVDPGTIMQLRGATVDQPVTVTIVHDAAGDRREHTFLLINNSFEHHLELVKGRNTITVRAEDAYGNYNVSEPHVVDVREEVVEETSDGDALYLVAAVLVAVAIIVVAYVLIKRP